MKTLGALLYPDFEMLDFYGPLEMFGALRDQVRIVTVAQPAGPVKASQGPATVAEFSFELKLNPETPIDENTKLIGGDHDLDSLDILMLVTALEKQCNVKIPDESIGRDAFENVGTLIEFIRERQA